MKAEQRPKRFRYFSKSSLESLFKSLKLDIALAFHNLEKKVAE